VAREMKMGTSGTFKDCFKAYGKHQERAASFESTTREHSLHDNAGISALHSPKQVSHGVVPSFPGL
jgi:hypothetical protein